MEPEVVELVVIPQQFYRYVLMNWFANSNGYIEKQSVDMC